MTSRLTREVLNLAHWRLVSAWVEAKFAKNPRLAFTISIVQERIASYRQRKFLFGGIYKYIAIYFDREGIVTDKGKRPTPEMIHAWAKRRYLDGSDGFSAFGTQVSAVASTKQLSRTEMQDYWLAIQKDFAERGWDIPDPNQEQMDLLFNKEG